jgi:hypothetical protein
MNLGVEVATAKTGTVCIQCVTVLFKCFALFDSLLCSGLLGSVV